MPVWLKRTSSDLKGRKNLELYLLLVVGGAVLVIDLFELASDTELIGPSVVFNAVLAVLLLLAFGMLGERHASEEIAERLEKIQLAVPAASFFSKWNNAQFQEKLAGARTVSILAVASYVNFRENEEAYKALLMRGGSIECILIGPDSDAARMESERSPGMLKSQEPKYLAKQIDLSVQTLQDIAEISGRPHSVTLKFADQLPPAVITILDRAESNAVAFITLNGFKQPFSERPSFLLSRSDDEEWFDFYAESFDALWNWSECRSYSLVDSSTAIQAGDDPVSPVS